jgi:DNA-binding transcriptional LysR family regulator
MDTIRSMRVFARVAQAASFASAARDLELSAATVTKIIAALEAQLSVRLMERTTRRVQLTEAGRFYLERCLETLQSIADTDDALSALSSKPQGTLRLTAPIDLGRDMARVIARYGERSPDVTVDLRLADHNIDLIDQGFDLGIGLPAPSHASYISRPLCATRLGVFASPSYLAMHGRPKKPADLARHRNLVFVEPEPRIRWTFSKGKRARFDVELRDAVRSNNGGALVQMCVNGMGIMISPSFGVHEQLRAGALVPLLESYELPSFSICVRYPSRRFLPAKVRAFLECLRDHFGDDPSQDPWRAR